MRLTPLRLMLYGIALAILVGVGANSVLAVTDLANGLLPVETGDPNVLCQNLCVTEIMYHPADPPLGHSDAEFIELTNIGATTLDLTGIHVSNAVQYDFAAGTLDPGAALLLVKDRSAMESVYETNLPIVGVYGGSLSNGGDTLLVYDAFDRILQAIRYEDNWYPVTDGQGYSLVANPIAGYPIDASDPNAWQPSANVGGSPGWSEANGILPQGSLVINEIMAHSHNTAPDWVELYNTTNRTLPIGGWFLSDEEDEPNKYEIAAGTTVAPHGYIVFYEDLHFGSSLNPGAHNPFALSDDGETLFLASAYEDDIKDYHEKETFGASNTGISFGRWQRSTGAIDFVSLAAATPGAVNTRPLIGPVVISEILYHPAGDDNAEYVEILNISDQPVLLYNAATNESWRFTDEPNNPSIDLRFHAAQDLVMAAGARVLLAKNRGALLAAFPEAAGTPIFTWPEGRLSNAREEIELSMAGEIDDAGIQHWVRVDRVIYQDSDDWPSSADGQGSALQRIDTQAYGNDPNNWQADVPSPGS